MKIIILGAGQVGGTLAENLAGENNDITIVDTDSERLRELQDKFDLRVVNGHGAHPRVLREAGAQDADMLVAVTNSDETNMVACQVAYSLFNTPNKVARIRSPPIWWAGSPVPARIRPRGPPDRPEQLVTDYVRRLIEYPGRCRWWILPTARWAWWRSRPITAAPWWAMRSPPCGNTCPTSKPGSPPSSARALHPPPGHHHHRSR